ncbi:MAG: ATP-grasp domain-containing protein [Planctomycetota bacterium]|nr:ATP-grasp domain-containing protein [Planctomycetota bacterium]
MISPGFPSEMPLFTSALAEVGARVFGIGDTPRVGLPRELQHCLSGYLSVASLWEEEQTVSEVQRWLSGRHMDRVEVLWEPGMMLAAKLRQALDCPGLTVEQTIPFRDKEAMKQKLDAAGIRTPHHYRATSTAAVEEAVEQIGYPIIIKPIDGAGSADTYPIHDADDLEQAIGITKHVPEVSVEEYIDGEEYTYDTVCSGGKPLFENVSWYRPGPLIARLNPWISTQCLTFRDLTWEVPKKGVDMGRQVLDALEFDAGFTHMEWFVKPDGEAVFGEIGGRAPGGRLVHLMNYACDIDLFSGWAEAVCTGRISQDTTKNYNAAVIFKRAQGQGDRITTIEGLERLMSRFSEHIVNIDLNQVGAPKRDWRKIVHGDGWIVVRHQDFDTLRHMSEAVATDLIVRAE